MSKQFLDYTGLTKFKELSDDHYDEIKNVTWQEYEAIEDKNDDKAYFITDVPPSEQKKTAVKPLPTGSISTVTDAAPLPLNALKVSVEAWQEGSGDPSPSNVRPIHGWDSGEISVVGKNWAKQVIIGWIDVGNNVVKVDNDAETVLFFANQGVKYTVSSQSTFDRSVLGRVDTDNVTHLTPVYDITTNSGHTWEATWTGWTVWYVKASRNTVIEQTAQVKISTQATTYEPYQGKQYALDFPFTIYGAEWDVVGGGLSQTDGYIASYNGESLPSTWISDRDVYASGTTPTTGAEVVYKLATPTTIDLSPLSIRMLEGTNNIYADCGDIIDGEYFGNNTNQIRVNDEIIAGGNSVTFAVESKYAEHAEVADNACIFSVDENGLLTISLVSGDSNNSMSSTRSVKSTTTLPPEEEITNEKSEEEEIKDESVEEPVEEESEIVEEKTDETEEELSENESEEPSVEEEKDNDDGGEETPPEQDMR